MDASKHRIRSLIPETGGLIPGSRRGQARVGPWAGAGLLAGGCLGCGYGILVGVAGGFTAAIYGAVFGVTIGLITGPLIGLLIGLAQVLLRRTAIPGPLIAVAVTELILLPPQILAAHASWWPETAVFIYIPSVLGIGAAAALGCLLPPAKRPLRRRGKPDPATRPSANELSHRLLRYRSSPSSRQSRPNSNN